MLERVVDHTTSSSVIRITCRCDCLTYLLAESHIGSIEALSCHKRRGSLSYFKEYIFHHDKRNRKIVQHEAGTLFHLKKVLGQTENIQMTNDIPFHLKWGDFFVSRIENLRTSEQFSGRSPNGLNAFGNYI